MKISSKEIEHSVGACGLICGLCGDRQHGCKGCGNNADISCGIIQCCQDKSLKGCYECSDYPCGVFPPGESKFNNIRVKAINRVAREEGLGKLAEYLARNHEAGIVYHRSTGLGGDYDQADENKAIDLIQHGKTQQNNIS